MAHRLASTRATDSVEILTCILRHTFSGEDPGARQQLRENFALAGRNLHNAVRQEFETVDIAGTEGLVRALERLTNPTDCSKVRRVYLQLASTRGKDKADKFERLLMRLGEVTELELVLSTKNLSDLEKVFRPALQALAKLSTFKLGPHKGRELPLLDSNLMSVIATSWRRLRSISLHVRIAWSDSRANHQAGWFHSLRQVHTLHLATTDTDCDRFFNGLPASVRTVVISHPDMYIQDAIPVDLYNSIGIFCSAGDDDALDGWKMRARHITSLTLCDPSSLAPAHSPEVLIRARGRFFDLIESLVDLRTLTCAPCVVESLVVLALMPNLRELTLMEDRAKLAVPLKCGEVVDLVSQGTMRRVSIGASIRRTWSELEQVRLESVALSSGCEVVWL